MAQRRRALVQGSLVALLAAGLAAANGAGGQTGPAAQDRGRPSVPSVPARGAAVAAQQGEELVDQRTARSRTYRTAGNNRTTKIFADAVNYRDGGGRMRAIDSALVSSDRPGFAYENRANDYEVALPADLADPVRIGRGASAVSFALSGAKADARVTGAAATYPKALEGVDVEYVAGPSSVKETLTLASAQAPSTFRFDLKLSDGLRPRAVKGRQIEFVRPDGSVAFSFAPPFMQDQTSGPAGFSDDVDLDVQKSADGYVATLRADRKWLQDPDRRFPVEVDPTLIFEGADDDCYLVSGADANTNFCAYSTLNAGWNGSRASRALLRFDISQYVPEHAEVLNAELGLSLTSRSTTTNVPVSVHGLTRSWTGGISGATWNTYNGTNPWSTPGGDFTAELATTNPSVGSTTGWKYWYPTKLVQSWVDGQPNPGMLLKTPESANQVLRFSSTYGPGSKLPYLAVSYEPRVGDLPRYTFDEKSLTNSLSAGVNIGNGNVLLHEIDKQYSESDTLYAIERYYNNLSEITTPTGAGWNMARGPDVGLLFFNDGSIGFDGPSGYTVAFQRNADGSYAPPEGVDLTLTRNPDGTFSIVDPNQRKLVFDTNGFLTAEITGGGGRIDYTYDARGFLTSQIDSRGRTTRYSYNGDGFLETTTDSTGAVHRYVHDSSGNLTRYTSPSGQQTIFYYQGLDLVRVRDAESQDTSFTYNSQGRVTAVIDGLATDSAAPRTTYSYGPPTSSPCDPSRDVGRTVVTRPGGSTITYCYDRVLRVTAQDPPSQTDPKVKPDEEEALTDDGSSDDGTCFSPPPGYAPYCGGQDIDPDAQSSTSSFGILSSSLASRSPWPWGLSDQNPVVPRNMFADERFRNLGVKTTRLVVPWNVALPGAEGDLDKASRWVAAALAAGKRPLISFERCRNAPTCNTVPPSLSEYSTAITRFLELGAPFTEIRDFTSWNEPNNIGYQPTAKLEFAELAGQYWFAFGRTCAAKGRTCNIAAGDFLDADMPNANGKRSDGTPSFGKAYFDAYRRGMVYQPCVWAFHPYQDGQRTLGISGRDDRWGRLRNFRIATQSSADNQNDQRFCGSSESLSRRSPSVWISEVGALLEQVVNGQKTVDNTAAEQLEIMRKLVSEVPEESERIKRFYYYHWHGDAGFDAGLLYRNFCSGCSGRPGWDAYRARPIYDVYRDATG